jgi:hypothetical protein
VPSCLASFSHKPSLKIGNIPRNRS